MAAPVWTQSDVDKLKAAVAEGVLSVEFEGPPRRLITYQSLAAMRSLLAEMIRQTQSIPSFRRATFSKGIP